MARFKQPSEHVNMTPMIDVVFQMIIFFVCTVQLEKEAISESILLPDSPNGSMVTEAKDPRTITIEVDDRGYIYIARTSLSESKLRKVLIKTVRDYGHAGFTIPIRIRAAGGAEHMHVKRVLDACTSAGLHKISFVAIKDRA